jgi:hypothetical protein
MHLLMKYHIMARVIKPFPYSIAQLEAIFILDRENGMLVRRGPARGRKRGVIPPRGHYRSVKLYGTAYFEHRVIWMMENKQHIPQGFEIDHINRDEYDNRPANLRLAVRQQNAANSTPQIARSGYRGVVRTRHGKFRASIVHNAVRHSLGTFSTAEEAAAAYDVAAVRLNAKFALTNIMLGRICTTPKAPLHSMDTIMQTAPAFRRYPGVPDMPLPLPRCAPTWTRHAAH